MTNIKKILATTLSILVVTSGTAATNAMVAVPNVPHQPFMPPIVGVPTVNSGQLSFKSIKTQIANFFSLSSKTDGQLKNTENLYSDESEEIGGQWEDRNKKVYDDIQWKFNPKNGELTVTGTGEIPFMNCFTEDCLPNLWESKKIADQIKTLAIGEGITEVGDCAFCYLVSLQKVYLPKSVTCINNHAFYGCTSLTEINLEDSNLTKMGYAALGSCNLSKIKLPSSLKEVGEKVFTANSNLKEVKFCGTDSPVCGSDVFENCVNLTDVKVPEGYKGSQFCEKSVDCALNENCKIGGTCGEDVLWELDDGTLSVIGTGEMNSYDNPELVPWKDYNDYVRSIIIDDEITTLGRFCFYNFKNLETVKLPKKLKTINWQVFGNCNKLANVEFPSGIEHIGSEAFRNTGLKNIILPSSINSLELNVFGECKDLKSIEVEENNVNYTSYDGILFTKDKKKILQYPAGLERRVYEIPAFVEIIGQNSFYLTETSMLEKIIVKDNVKEVSDYAFFRCPTLKTIIFYGDINKIGTGAFRNCTSLTNVNFNGLSDPGCSDVFEDCDKLESVNVPECYENNTFCEKNVSKILNHGNCKEPEPSSSIESSQSPSKLSSSSISEVNFGPKRVELIFSKEDIQISLAEESIKDIIDLDPGQYKITVKVIDNKEVKVTVQFANEDDLNGFYEKVSKCTK